MTSKMLMEILKTQDLNLDLLIKSLEEQKKAIVHNDYEGLRKLLDDEQRLLKEISIEEAVEEISKRIITITDLITKQLKGLNNLKF